ncbi:hypothetical protein BJ912DRAFT_1144204 [Pholiota molesta]|nr:hypothetical protein BJ912DRAFT_1144204 [Pholiota molesta]
MHPNTNTGDRRTDAALLCQRRTDVGYVVATHPKANTVVSTWTSVPEYDDV